MTVASRLGTGRMFNELITAFGIVAICLIIHVTGMILLGDELVRRRAAIARRASKRFSALLLMGVFVFMLLMHAIEAGLWATFYRINGLFDSFETSLYFSLITYSTIGHGDVLLPDKWRILGTVEGISGVLLCGLSTAFLFAIIDALFRFRAQQLMDSEKTEQVQKTR